MNIGLFGSELWRPTLDKYAAATGLTVELFEAGGSVILSSAQPTPLFALFREYGFEPGLFADCASRCLRQSADRPAVAVVSAPACVSPTRSSSRPLAASRASCRPRCSVAHRAERRRVRLTA